MSEKFLLLFEDDDTTAKNIIDQLEYDKKFKVKHAKNQDQLRDYLEPDHYSVIVTDVQIDTSDIPATEIIHNIRRKRRISRTPIIVYSGVKNMDVIKKEENKMFRHYVTKGRGWLSELEDHCLLSAEEDRHLVSWRTFEGYFEEEKIIDLPILNEDITSAAIIMGITLGDKTTNRTIIDWLKNPKLEDDAWHELEELLWKKYTDHYSENHKTQ